MSKIIDATLRLIDDFSSPLNKAAIEMRNKTKQIQQDGKKLQAQGKAISSVGKKWTTAVSLPLAALGVASAKSALNFEDGMAKINTLLDNDGNLKKYEKAVKKTSNETGKSVTDMSDGMYQTISALGDQGSKTTKMFSVMAKSAKAGGAQTSEAVSLITSGMKGYSNVSEGTAKKISDLAFNTQKLGVTTFPEMATEMQKMFPLGNSLNMSYEELFGTMATLTGVTGNTAEVSTQMKGVMTGLMKPTKSMSALIAKYGYENGESMVKAKGFSGVMKIMQKETGGQSDKMAKLFGNSRALTAALALTGAQAGTFDEKLKKLQNSTGATDTAYKKMETTQEKLHKVWNRLKNTGIDFGNAVLKVSLPYIQKFASKVEALSDRFSKLSNGQKEAIVKFGMAAIAVGPLLIGFGKLVTIVGKAKMMFGSTAGAIEKAGSIGKWLATGPTALIVAGLAAVVVAGVLVYKNWDKITAAAKKLGSWTNKVFKSMGIDVGSIKKKFKEMRSSVAASLGQLEEPAKKTIQYFQPIVKFVGQIFIAKLKIGFSAAIGLVRGLVRGFMETASGVITVFQGISDFVSGVFTGNWKKAWTGVKTIFVGIFQSFAGIVKTPMNAVIGLINGAIKGLNSIKIDIPDWVPKYGGKKFGLSVPTIPALYKGTDNWQGGITTINERGGEIIDLPRGSRVYPHDKSVQMAKNESSQKSITINISKLADKVEIRDESDIQKVAEELARLLLDKETKLA